MMFSLRNFVKGGLLKAVGNMADYQVILNAAGWLEKGVLEESNLADIQSAIDAKNAPNEIPVDESIETPTEIEPTE